MLENSKSTNSTMPSSKFTTQLNLSKCTLTNGNPLQFAGDSDVDDGQLNFWPPTTAVVDRLVLKLKAKDGDTEANWEKIMLNFKKELDAEEQLPSRLLTSDVINISGDGIEKRDRVRAKFSVPLSRREMEKDFEDMGERRLPRKPKKRPKSVQNQLDTLFPGLWLTEINADLYRVSDTKKEHKMATLVCPSNKPPYMYISDLINFWYVVLNRGNLRQKHWQEVADTVNGRHGHTKKALQTDIQYKNQIDTPKKKYKVEKSKVSELGADNYVSPWSFFAPLDSLIGSSFKPSTQTPTSSPQALNVNGSSLRPHTLHFLLRPHRSLSALDRNGRHRRSTNRRLAFRFSGVISP